MTDTQSKTAGSEVAKASILAEAAEIAMGGWHSVEKARAFACSVSDYLLSTQAGALQAVDSEWSGWACQKPGKLPRLYGALEIAELNLDEDDAEDRLIFLSTQRALTSAEIDALPAEQWFKWRESRASRKDREAAAAVSSAEEDAHSPNCDIFTGGRACNCGAALATTQPDAAPTAEVVAMRELLAYVLQDEQHNRLTPRVIDIAYTAFMLAKQPNTEDGGSSDWFNDTRPAVRKAVEKMRKDFAALAAPAAAIDARVPEGMALVPIKMTRAMQDATDQEGWEWRDLLAAAEAVTEEQYNATIDAREQEIHRAWALMKNMRNKEAYAILSALVGWDPANSVPLASRSEAPEARPNAAGQEQGEWEPVTPEQHTQAFADGDLMAFAEEAGGARMAENVVQVTRSDIERIMEFVEVREQEKSKRNGAA